MSVNARAESRPIPANRASAVETVVHFNPKLLKAPFLLRCGAILIDYIFIVSIPILSLILGRILGNDSAKLLNSELSNAGWLIAVLLAATNFLFLPTFGGQSIGKIITGIRIVQTDGKIPNFGRLLLRHLVGYPLTILTFGLGLIFIVFNREGRVLHDYIARTVVIYGEKRRLN